MHRVYAPEATPPIVVLPPAEAHHVGRVLRLRAGEEVVVFDGRGREWRGRLVAAERGAASVELIAERPAIPEPAVAITLAVGLLKGDHLDTVVRDATALGVAAIAPLSTARVAIPDRARQTRARERWTRVAIAAAKQCGRAVVPSIEDVTSLAGLLSQAGGTEVFCCVEPGSRGVLGEAGQSRPARALVLVGPEGGWAETEVARCRAAGAVALDLGPRILRAELAPAVALSLLWARWGWR